MRKYNFILTKDTAALLIYRIKKMISVTDACASSYEYTGRRATNGFLESIGLLESHRYQGISAIIKTTNTWWIKDKVKCRIDSNACVFNMDGVYAVSIPFGTKMFMSSEKIQWKNSSISITGNGSTATLKPYPNMATANHNILYETIFQQDRPHR